MGEEMTVEEIEARFPSEWVLVADPEVEDNLTVKRGKVLLHCKDRAEFIRKMQGVQFQSAAILYTGKIKLAENQAILL